MYQRSLLDDVLTASNRVVEIIGSAPVLTPAQKKFNQLIERLTQQREELARWRIFRQAYHEQVAGQYEPAVARLRDRQIAMVRLLDRTLDGKALSQRERRKVRDMMGHLLSQLLSESQDPELVRLHDKYAARSFDDERQDQLETLRKLGSEVFGVDVDAYEGGESPDELAQWLENQVEAGQQEPQRRRTRKPTAKARAREALLEQAADGATRAVREVFRKLVSELHPDRETDPVEHARKTELMQRVNQAYKAGDLLALLELQLGIEQIDPAALAGLAEERLRHYIHVLDEQSRRLRDELTEFVAPFARAMGDSSVGKLSPASVQRSLEVDIQEIHYLVRTLEADLVRFEDVQTLKRSLRDYQIDPSDDLDLSLAAEFRPRRPRRGRGRAP